MTALWTALGKPAVLDMSYAQPDPIDFHALYADGVRMIIHKSSQGTGEVDNLYAKRRPLAIAAGLKWEAYHFCNSSSVAQQLAHFLAAAELDSSMRGALDVETNKQSTISPENADAFAANLDQRLGAQALRYTGAGYFGSGTAAFLKHAIAVTPRFRDGPIWWAKYGPAPTAEQLAGFGIDPTKLVLWQESESDVRPGIKGNVDASYWLGSLETLAAYPVMPAFPRVSSPVA